MGFLLAWAVFHFSLQPLLHCTAPLRGAAALVASTLSKRGAVHCPCPWELHVVCPCAVRVTTTVDHPGAPLLSLPCRPRRDNCFCVFFAFASGHRCGRLPVSRSISLSSLSLVESHCQLGRPRVRRGVFSPPKLLLLLVGSVLSSAWLVVVSRSRPSLFAARRRPLT